MRSFAVDHVPKGYATGVHAHIAHCSDQVALSGRQLHPLSKLRCPCRIRVLFTESAHPSTRVALLARTFVPQARLTTVLAPTAMKRALLCCDSSMTVYPIQDCSCSNVPRFLLPHFEVVLVSDWEVCVGWFEARIGGRTKLEL